MQYNGSQTVLDIRDDLGATMNECREGKISTSAFLEITLLMVFIVIRYRLNMNILLL